MPRPDDGEPAPSLVAFPHEDDDWHQWARADGLLEFAGEPGEAAAAAIAVRVGEGWAVRIKYEPEPEPHISEVVFRPAEDGAMIGARMLRRAGFGAAVEAAEAVLNDYAVASTYLGEPWSRTPRRPGRAGRHDAEWAEWAKRYVDALEANPRSPIRHIVDQMASEGVHATVAEVRAKVNKTRPRFLTRTGTKGKAGGELTDEAVRILREMGRL